MYSQLTIFNILQKFYFVWCNWCVPGSSMSTVVCILHTLWSVHDVIYKKCDFLRYIHVAFFLSHGGLDVCCDRSFLYYSYCCTLFILGRDTLEFHVCVPHFHARNYLWKKHSAASKMWYWRTGISPSRSATIYVGVSCMMSYSFWGGREILSSSTKWKALYPLLHLVHVIAVCSVVCSCYIAVSCFTGTKMHERAFGHSIA